MYQAFLEQNYPSQEPTIARYTLGAETVWLKRAAKRNSRLAYAPLTLLAKWLNIEVLKPVPNLGGHQSIATEIARLHSLKAAGIEVPRLLATHSQALLLEDAGTPEAPARTLLDRLKRADSEADVDHVLTRSIDALIEVHRRECYLSEGFARNILMSDDRVVFIDFETDPGDVHSSLQCMVRDWYCLIFSLYGKLHKRPLVCQCLTPTLIDGLTRERSDVLMAFKSVLPALLRLRRIPFKYLGGDGRGLHVTLDALVMLHQRLP
ncbi:RIO1 family regulatory kinase/ATPase [Vreelandella malpeensis]|uniref:Serine/threonine protein kinase n=1 Tax=Vreelandella malpeensis TaxID=1172368 RepID=A0ABS8DXD4_9GAMM|nr:RIO1 family regulatory kinase/ATPase [Halomonas malpeensis]MCB8890638.1 hypothetical protein [Halomonas malpeensis]